MKVLGSDSFENYLFTYSISLVNASDDLLQPYALVPRIVYFILTQPRSFLKLPWTRFITSDNRATATPEAIDLVDRLLRFDHRERLTAAEAMAHTYFSTCPRDWSQRRSPVDLPPPDAVRLQTPSNPAECPSDSGFYST